MSVGADFVKKFQKGSETHFGPTFAPRHFQPMKENPFFVPNYLFDDFGLEGPPTHYKTLVDVSDIFYFFPAWGGEGGVQGAGGVRVGFFFLKIPGGGKGFPGGGAAEGPGGCLW